MTIEKNGKVYVVKRNARSWTVELDFGKLSTSVTVPFSVAEDFEALEAYVLSEDLF